jgi:hypothetical protein
MKSIYPNKTLKQSNLVIASVKHLPYKVEIMEGDKKELLEIDKIQIKSSISPVLLH